MQFPQSVNLPCQPNLLRHIRRMCYNGLLFSSIHYTKSKTSKLEQMQFPSSVDLPCQPNLLRHVRGVRCNRHLFGSIAATLA